MFSYSISNKLVSKGQITVEIRFKNKTGSFPITKVLSTQEDIKNFPDFIKNSLKLYNEMEKFVDKIETITKTETDKP